MSKKDNLLQFIHLMTASEKKYFKQFISVRKDSKFYAALFDLLLKQEEYDATTLSKKLKKTPKQISDAKDYLMQVLLKSMENFHADTTPMIRVNNLLNQAEIASLRGIPSLALDLLDKAESICEKFDFFLPLIAIYKRRQSLYAVQYDLSESLNTNIKIDEYLTKEKNLTEYRALHKKIVHLTLPKRDKSIDVPLEYFQTHPLLQRPSEGLSVTAKTFYYRVMIWFQFRFGDKRKSYQLVKELYALIKENPDKFDDNDHVKGGCLVDCLGGLDVHCYEEFCAIITDLEALAAKVKSSDNQFYYQLYAVIALNWQGANTAMGNFTDGINYYYKLINNRSEFENISQVPRALILFESAYCFYFEGESEMAAKLMQEIEKLKVKTLSAGRTFMRQKVLLAMMAFDDGNSVTMDSHLIAAKRHAEESNCSLKELNFIHKTMTRLLHSKLSQPELDTIVDKTKALRNSRDRLSFVAVFHFDQWVLRRAAIVCNLQCYLNQKGRHSGSP